MFIIFCSEDLFIKLLVLEWLLLLLFSLYYTMNRLISCVGPVLDVNFLLTPLELSISFYLFNVTSTIVSSGISGSS